MSGIDHLSHRGTLVWVRNPFSGAVTYFTEVHRKRSGFVRSSLPSASADDPLPDSERARMEQERRACPFCPGNEGACADEVLRVPHSKVSGGGDDWAIRAVRNIVPRVPEICTGGRNESYVVIEDPRHFVDPEAGGHLLHTSLLEEPHFQALLDAIRDVVRHAHENPAVRSVLVRKNQGWRSGASQPHAHSQVIGADQCFPAVARESEVTARQPRVWEEIVEFVRAQGYMIREEDGCYAYFCPFGAFPRSYEIVALDDRTRMVDVPTARWTTFSRLLRHVLRLLGSIPLDLEIHDEPGIPLHAHVNTRHFPYSNVGGTLNLPVTLAEDPRLAQVLR